MPPVDPTPASPPTYWRSLEERADSPEFREMVEREFPGEVWESLPPATRRGFLKVMGASLALAGLAGCRWPKEEIVSFSRPAGYTPGVPLRYATSIDRSGVGRGLLVVSYDGRPIKVEGNPKHPGSLGAADAIDQASILDLYDPDRSRYPISREAGTRRAQSWEDFERFVSGRLATARTRRGAGLAILTEATSSPSVADLRRRLAESAPEARWFEYEPLTQDNERIGASIAFGKPMRPLYHLKEAAIIVCLDADPLGADPSAIPHARDFAEGRRSADQGSMSRLHVIESGFSITGSMADNRHAILSREIPAVAAQIALGILGAEASSLALAAGPEPRRFVAAIVEELLAHRGRSLILAGPGQPPEVHALVHRLNEALGNFGHTVELALAPDPERPTHRDAILSLAAAIDAGAIETLVILGGNPAYDAPADLDFAGLLPKVPVSIHLSLHENETSKLTTWHLPRAHDLEAWGDTRASDGTIGVAQPLIEPLYGGRSPIEILSILVDSRPLDGHAIVRRTHGIDGDDSEAAWRRILHEGVMSGTAFPLEMAAMRPAEILARFASLGPPAGDPGGLELVFRRDAKVHDGRFANNGWLQEMPDPLTKITWDNAAILAPSTARELGLQADDRVRLSYNGREVDAAVYVLPGHAAGSVTLNLGYGRTAAGRVGNDAGFDFYRLRGSEALHFASGLSIRKIGGKHAFACTQNHHTIDAIGLRGMERRLGELFREADLAEYKAHPEFAKHRIHDPGSHQLYPPHDYSEGPQWGMAIDLNSCTGCGACVVACVAENNVPVVGRDQIRRGREMHWLRIDRYFRGGEEAPQIAHQPVACVQCENAPCEQVCPVSATVHTREGLNAMAYNRCVGTRYCSNNCPYKVRRFNWFNFHKETSETEKMGMNPEVTVRGRGVMEKCTYCVQRIEAVKIVSKNEGRRIRDGEITPACAQTCPTQAIVFGDLSDPESRVSKLHGHARAYGLLEEINTRPRTQYLAKVRNPIPGAGSPIPADGLEEHHG